MSLVDCLVHKRCELGDQGAFEVFVVFVAASLAADNWLGESPDNGRFPVRPFSLTPNVAR